MNDCMRIERDVYLLVLNATTPSFAENVDVKFTGVRMTSVDGDVVEINNRQHEIMVEQAGGGNLKITIAIVNECEVVEERIDYMLEEEYEIEPIVEVFTKSNHNLIAWSLNLRDSYQTKRMMEMDMNPDVKEAVSFITSAAVGYSDEFVATLINELNTGKYQHVLDFINNLANL